MGLGDADVISYDRDLKLQCPGVSQPSRQTGLQAENTSTIASRKTRLSRLRVNSQNGSDNGHIIPSLFLGLTYETTIATPIRLEKAAHSNRTYLQME